MKYLLRIYVRPWAGGHSLHYKWNRLEIREFDSLKACQDRLDKLPNKGNGYAYEIYYGEPGNWTLVKPLNQILIAAEV